MKLLIILLIFPFLLIAQDNIDPLPIITDTPVNYNIIDPIQHNFFLGWNWGSPSKKLDDALYMNFYHDFPLNCNNEYAKVLKRHIFLALIYQL